MSLWLSGIQCRVVWPLGSHLPEYTHVHDIHVCTHKMQKLICTSTCTCTNVHEHTPSNICTCQMYMYMYTVHAFMYMYTHNHALVQVQCTCTHTLTYTEYMNMYIVHCTCTSTCTCTCVCALYLQKDFQSSVSSLLCENTCTLFTHVSILALLVTQSQPISPCIAAPPIYMYMYMYIHLYTCMY